MDNCLLNPENRIGVVYVNYVGQAIKKVYFFTEKKENMRVLHQCLACSLYQLFIDRVVFSGLIPIRMDVYHES